MFMNLHKENYWKYYWYHDYIYGTYVKNQCWSNWGWTKAVEDQGSDQTDRAQLQLSIVAPMVISYPYISEGSGTAD